MKKILTFICVLTIGFLSLFNVKTNYNSFLSASAYDNTYNYTSEVSSSTTSIDSYAIDSISYISFTYGEVVKLSLTATRGDLAFLYFNEFNDSYSYGNIFNLTTMYFNASDGTSIVLVAKTGSYYTSSTSTGFLMALSTGTFDIYFCYNVQCEISGGKPVFTPKSTKYSLADTSLIDMVADTNTSIFYRDLSYFESNLPYSFYTEVIKMSFGVQTPRNFSTSGYSSYGNIALVNTVVVGCVSSCNFALLNNYVDSSTISNNNFGYNLNLIFSDITFSIHRPVYRVNNTLIIYIYDYLSLPQNISSVSYSMTRGNDLYNITYNGSVPNSYFCYFYNNDIQNILFDEYIIVDISFSDSFFSPNFNYDDFSYSVLSGFDFNFTYYAQPLNSANGVYSYDFDKPSYVAMPFSFSPFYIPVLEAVENALIFLLFYCPLVSDILELLHMSEFLGSLITVINYYTTGVLGTFITALLSFFIFYLFFKSILPTVSSGVGSLVDNSYIGYSSNRKKEEKYTKMRNRKELRHRSKLIDKEYKKRERNKKRGIPD